MVILGLLLAAGARAQTLNLSNGVTTVASLTGYTVTLSGRSELRVSAPSAPLSGCTINLTSVDSCLVLPGVKPSVVVSTYLSQVKISGAAAVADSNCRVVQYAMGAIVLPHPSSFQPLTVYSAPYFNGTAMNLGQYTYYKTGLGSLYANISSFRLKRGYMAVMAQTESGTGISKTYVAQDGDIEVSLLPADFDNSIRFIYVTPWRWTSKKGIAGDPGISQLNVRWDYNWNLNKNSTRDEEYVAIRQLRWWPSLSQTWSTLGVNTVLGYNEPDSTAQANILVGDAIWSWPDLLATGLRVGSPAPTDGGRSSWLYPFITQADAANLRVDFVALHYYWCFNPSDPAGAANQLYSFLKATYDQTKRPIWITEWNNGANWTTCGDPTYPQQQAAVAAMINMLDTTPFVERYALYNWVEDVRALTTNSVLTAAGVTYRDQQSPIGYVQSLPGNGTRSFTQLRFETNVLDSSGYGNNGVTSGSPAYTNGYAGQALVFDGTNTAVTLPPNVAGNNAFTFAAWIRWDGGANWQRVFDFGNSTTHYLFLTPHNGSVMRFAIANGGGEQRVDAPALVPNQWVHLALTLSGSTAKLYTNGVLAAQNTGMSISPASFSPRVNRLGKSQYFSDPLFKGAMDEVLVTDYALSAAQVAMLQTNTPPQFTNSVIARGSATEAILYSNTLAGAATDIDPGDTLTFSKATGPAWLNIAANGILTGTPSSADGGTNYFSVRVTDAAGQSGCALLTVIVTTLTASGVWTADASANWGETNRWSANTVASGISQTADFSTINITANRIVTIDSSRTIGNLKFSDIAGSQSWTLTNAADSTLTLNSASSPLLSITNTATIAAPLMGTNGFTKSGPGTLILTGNNSISGTVNIDTGGSSGSDGILRIVGPNALANASLMTINKNNSGTSTLQLDGSTGDITINANFTVTYRLATAVTIQNLAGTNIFNGSFAMFQGGNSHSVQCDSGLIVFTGTNQYVGGLVGIRTNYFTGAGNHLVIGPILDSTNGSSIYLTKNGIGRLTLAGVNTYGGSTLVNAGSLYVDGVLPAAPLALAGGTTLGGNGIIQAAVTIPSGATLAPGENYGRLTVSNSVTLQAGSTTRIELNKALGTNDQLRVTGSLAYGGTLVVTNLEGTLWAGDSFQIVNGSTPPAGAFFATNLPALPNGFKWQWSGASGILSITSTVALYPTNLNIQFSGGALQLGWPVEHTGWRLQAQTNDLAYGFGTNWADVPGTTLTNSLTIPVDPASGNVFYRLVFP